MYSLASPAGTRLTRRNRRPAPVARLGEIALECRPDTVVYALHCAPSVRARPGHSRIVQARCVQPVPVRSPGPLRVSRTTDPEQRPATPERAPAASRGGWPSGVDMKTGEDSPSPFSTYSAPGALRQGPGRASESPTRVRTKGHGSGAVRVLSSTYRSRGDVEPVVEPGDGYPGGGPTPLGPTALRTAMAGVTRTDRARELTT